MANMNFLKGGIQGKLGQSYGYRRKTANVISAVPFSHTPHNSKQKASFRAFSNMQKFNAFFAREFFRFSGLSAKNKNPINVVAHHFKPMIYNHQFQPDRIDEVIPENNFLEVTGCVVDENTKTVTITFKNRIVELSGVTEKFFIYMSNFRNEMLDCEVRSVAEQTFSVFVTLPSLQNFWLVAIKSSWINKKYRMTSGLYFEKTDIGPLLKIWYQPPNKICAEGDLELQGDIIVMESPKLTLGVDKIIYTEA